jgi:phage antirepressor YoqD-like protein
MRDITMNITDITPFTTSTKLAEEVALPHKSVIKLIRKHKEELGILGTCNFETEYFETAGGRQSREVALISKQQALVLVGHMRSSEAVKKYTKRLLKEDSVRSEQTPEAPQAPNQKDLITVVDGEARTSTTIIADSVNMSHASVIKLVRKHLSKFETFGTVRFKIQSFATAGGQQKREIALLNEPQATLLITFMKNTEIVSEFKVALVKAFYEFAQQVRTTQQPAFDPNSLTRMDILKMAVDSEERALKFEAENNKLIEEKVINAPKVEFHDNVVASNDTYLVREAAKILGTGQNRLFAILREHNWVTDKNEPYQSKVDQKYLDMKLHEFEHPIYGTKTKATTLITSKGLAKLQQVIKAS